MANIDPELLGQELAKVVNEKFAQAMTGINERMRALEAKTEGMQSKLDKCMAFAGDFQSALDYGPGSLVRRNGEMYVAVKHIKAGTPFTAREGSGWERVL